MFHDATTSAYVALKAPLTVTTSYSLFLPVAAGTADQVLKTDGSGNLGWTTPTAVFKGRVVCAGTATQVISNTNVTAGNTIIVSYEDPADGAVISVAVGSRVAGTSFKVLFWRSATNICLHQLYNYSVVIKTL